MICIKIFKCLNAIFIEPHVKTFVKIFENCHIGLIVSGFVDVPSGCFCLPIRFKLTILNFSFPFAQIMLLISKTRGLYRIEMTNTRQIFLNDQIWSLWSSSVKV